MHEVSLVAELVEVVERRAAGRAVTVVRVRHATTIPDDVLRQAWAMLTEGGPLGAADLDAEPFEIRISRACGYAGPIGHDDLVAGSIAVCPTCGSVVPVPATAEIELVGVEAAG